MGLQLALRAATSQGSRRSGAGAKAAGGVTWRFRCGIDAANMEISDDFNKTEMVIYDDSTSKHGDLL